MTQKCVLCKKEIGATFLDKLDGTIIKIGEGETSKNIMSARTVKKNRERI